MNKADKKTLGILLGAGALIGIIYWWSGELAKQRQLEIALPEGVQAHYARVNSIPEVVIYEE